MPFLILILLKFTIFTSIINVSFNRITVIIISTLITVILLAGIYKISKKKNRARNMLIFYTILSSVMIIDSIYYGHFNSLPSIIAVKQASQLGAVGDSLKFLLNFKIIMLAMDIPFLIYFYIRMARKSKNMIVMEAKNIITVSSIALIAIFVVVGLTGQLTSIKAQELYTYHAIDIKDSLLSKDKTSNKVEALTNDDIDSLKERTRLKEGKHTGIAKGRNVIVLQIEGFQNFVLNLDYNNQEITPNLNKLIKDQSSIYFSDYHQLLGRGNTSDAEFVTNNSLYPSMEEPTYSQFEKNTFYSLANLLKEDGYTSWAFHGYEKPFWNREKAYPNQGFSRFLSEEDYEFDREDTIAFGIKDEDFYSQTVDYLEELDKIDENPFYAFVISLSSHTPFSMNEKYNVLDIKDEHKDNMVGDYIQSVHYADYAIGLFLDDLKEKGLYDDSIIAMYGDHFGISAAQDEAALMEEFVGHEYDFDDMMNIPLIINIPGENVNEEVDRVGSQIDFLPTMLNLMGYDNDKGIMFGRDLINYEADNFVASQTYMLKGSFITDDYLFDISRDNIFEHSRLINRHTREELDVNLAEDISNEVIGEINKSNYILESDHFKGAK